MMAIPAAPHRYYNSAQRPLPSPYRSPLLSQYEAFLHYQSQQYMPQAQLSWRTPACLSSLAQPSQLAGPQSQYTPQPFHQLFMPQHQYYSEQHSRLLFITNAISQAVLNTQSAPYITHPAADLATYNPSRQPSNPAQAIPRQIYQSNQPYLCYQKAKEKGIYQVNKSLVENEPKDFYIIFENKADKVSYLDEKFDKIIVNFVGIETSCTKCRAIFPSKSKFYNYLRSGCLEISLPSLPAQAPSPISVIASKVVYQSFDSRLVFRGQTYAIALITLTFDHLSPDSEPDTTTCLDTGCKVTLVDKA